MRNTWTMFGFPQIVNNLKKLDFKTPEEYTEWRNQWRSCYKVLTKEVRALRTHYRKIQKQITVERKESNWGPSFHPYLFGKHLMTASEHYVPFNDLCSLERDAYDMMTTLELAKAKWHKMQLTSNTAGAII